MKHVLLALWRDERAFVFSAEIVLISTVAILALIVGLATYRDALIEEMADNAHAVGALNQSYSVQVADNGNDITVAGDVVTVTREYGDDGMGNPVVTVVSTFNNFEYQDQADFCEDCEILHVVEDGINEGTTVMPLP